MGFLTDFVFKTGKDKKFWITLISDIALIIVFIWFALTQKGVYVQGYDDCKKDACVLCLYETHNITNTKTNLTEEILNSTKK
jgi:hypothetical protein